MIKFLRINWFYWLSFVVFAGIVGLGFITFRVSEIELRKGQISNNELVARADAANLKNFFDTIGNSISLLAQRSTFESMDASTVNTMDAFVEQWRHTGLVAGIIFVDNKGVLALNSNLRGTREIGVDLSDRDYFIWAKSQRGEGNYFVGKPVIARFGPVTGQSLVTISSPVFSGNVFLGSLTTSFYMEELIRRTVGLTLLERSRIYFLDKQGNQLYSSESEDVLSGEIKADFNAGKSGYIVRDGRQIGYAPVLLNNDEWVFVVSSPVLAASNSAILFNSLKVAVYVAFALTALFLAKYIFRKVRKRLR